MAKKKLTKNDLQGDELKSFFDRTWGELKRAFSANPDIAKIVVFILVLIVIGIPAYSWFHNRQENRATSSLSEGKMYVRQGRQAPTEEERQGKFQAAVSSFSTVVQEYNGTSSYAEALKDLGLAYVALQQYTSAVENYDRFLAEFPDHPCRPQVEFARAGALQEMGKFPEAISVYQALLQDEQASYLRPQLIFQLASLYDFGMQDYERAIEYYKQVPRPEAGEAELWYVETRHRLAALGVPVAAVAEEETDA